MADSRALRVIALPAALRVALFSKSRHSQEAEDSKYSLDHFSMVFLRCNTKLSE